ncbi:MAG: outer membrane lipoprotein carrier protein LolA [Elusimicrobia bacterium]|nr:outer membrane lipoprotein carrier protein LolA [Elusimicrobiota bacterium]
MRIILSGVLALTLCSAAFAQPKKKTVPAKKAKKEAAAVVSTAAVKAVSPLPAKNFKKDLSTSTAVIDGLKDWDVKLETLSAKFTQEVNFSEAGLKQTVEGELKYSKPNLLRIEHFKPARQLVVTDKHDIWIYKPEDAQVVKTSWEAWRRTQSDNFSGILDFGNYSALTEKNDTAVSGQTPEHPYVTVVFTPKVNPEQYRLSLTLSATDYFPIEAELTVDKTTIKTTLSGAEINKTLAPELFKFSPPKGTQILEFKN